MGDHEGWAQPSGLLPNGLLPNEAAGVTRVLDAERWLKVEERTGELISCIQPNEPSEDRRNAVADYVQRLIMKCFSCQVFTFGSVPLKTYLPDGDIDLTAFSNNPNLKDTWANEVREVLESEEKSENAEFRVKEVQYIQAEVKLIKCLVENIVVDISFNQLGGLCTLCFLEEVDHLIGHNHLFKRSIILIKAWCYYESRILGAHHGLISTYALETLVLYIFHVFNNSFTGPLEVLYRFLEFFSNFDWDNFCVSLWGPVPISSLPDMTVEPPRKDGGELLLNKVFLDACSSVYAVIPGGQENLSQPFVSKHFNVIDPLRTNNNLGRSVSKGNFYRIRSAFAFGAKRLARLLECPKESLIAEVNQFFMNTWERHGSGQRPDAPSPFLWNLRPSNSSTLEGTSSLRNQASTSNPSGRDDGLIQANHVPHVVEQPVAFRRQSLISESVSRVSRSLSQKTHGSNNHDQHLARVVSAQASRSTSSSELVNSDKVPRMHKPDYSVLEREVQGRYHFARTRSSPELTDTTETSLRGRRNRVGPEVSRKTQFSSSRPEIGGGRRKNVGPDIQSVGHSIRPQVEDPLSVMHSSSHQNLDGPGNSTSASNSYQEDGGTSGAADELASVTESVDLLMHQEEQDLVNMMAASSRGYHGFNGPVHIPMNLGSLHLSGPISPSVLASMGYAQRNLTGMVPTNLPLIDPAWGSGMQFSQGLVPSRVPHYFPNLGLGSNHEDVHDSGNENTGTTELNEEELGNAGFWQEKDLISTGGPDPEDSETAHMLHYDNKQQSKPIGFGSIPPTRNTNQSGGPFIRGQQHHKVAKGPLREDHGDSFQYPNSRGSDTSERSVRSLPGQDANSSRTKAGSESSWDGSSTKSSKSSKEKRGRKVVAGSVYGKTKTGWQNEGGASSLSDQGSVPDETDNREWHPISNVGVSQMTSRTMGPTSPHARAHQLPNYEPAQVGDSDSMIPIGPMLVAPGSQRQRPMDNPPGVVPFAFYPTGPPVPFVTMVPVYNFPAETGNSDGSPSHVDGDDGLDGNRMNQSDHGLSGSNFDAQESIDQSEVLLGSSTMEGSITEPREELKSDILNSDFISHWQNLQYGRFCQNPRYHGPLIYPSPMVVPPVYLQGHFPWDGPGRPMSTNMNIFTQLMGYGPRLVPVAPLQPGSNRPAGVYQHFGDDGPRYRGGTGTYLPNPRQVPFRDRQSPNNRTHRANYNFDHRNDQGDRDGGWNSHPKPRGGGARNHNKYEARNPAEKPGSRLDRPERFWEPTFRQDSFASSFQANNVHFAPAQNSGPMAYGMYPINTNGVGPAGPTIPSVVMLYPYDQNVGYVPPDQLEFGSLGPVHFSTVNEASHLGDQQHGTYQGGSPVPSSPDQPSSPQIQRSTAQRNYQLKEEDFPPLNQGGGGSNPNPSRASHHQNFLFTLPHHS
ncbi:uncharacterized protein LOC18440727 isoform X1 [Amborella trichopoda]|uniref:uncharacterized protein LOC18440727 isoform X1 n=1 Tax=Amborella trichopoda TaxID=13333 RepID=UPI0005D3E588|nr:uncharacterized protein LOC18440727 isoform X1 [Amborella trichopoda]|eukprot:XP_011625756.1 uncharacterized protein LOC18440727 isoform X1 [Amborella trichopoda]